MFRAVAFFVIFSVLGAYPLAPDADEPLFDDCTCFFSDPNNKCCFVNQQNSTTESATSTTTAGESTTSTSSTSSTAPNSTPSSSSPSDCGDCNKWKWIGVGVAAAQLWNAAGILLLWVGYRHCNQRPHPEYAPIPASERSPSTTGHRSPSTNPRTAECTASISDVRIAPATPTIRAAPSSSARIGTATVPPSSSANCSTRSATGTAERSPSLNGSPAAAAMAQSIPPGDITTQPGTKIVFNAPCVDNHTYYVKIVNAGGRRIGWAINTTNMKRLGVDPPCGVLDPKEAVLMAVSCDSFVFGQEDTNNDRITIEWTNTPDGAAKQFRREWFQGDGMVRRKNLPIEYNP